MHIIDHGTSINILNICIQLYIEFVHMHAYMYIHVEEIACNQI